MRLLSIDEVADLLGISKYHAYEMARRGDIPRVLIGRVVRVPEDALRAFIERGGRPRPAILAGTVKPESRRSRTIPPDDGT